MTFGFLPLHVFLDMEGDLHGAWAAQWWMFCDRVLLHPTLKGSVGT